MKRNNYGFTIIELLFIILIFSFASILFFMQKNDIQTIADDNHKKTAINSMHYALEEVFYENNKYYPQMINSETLKAVDPELFTDTLGIEIGEAGSEYSYSATNCSENKCKNYTLKAMLSKEAEYIKTNKN